MYSRVFLETAAIVSIPSSHRQGIDSGPAFHTAFMKFAYENDRRS
jgi:hypothetical protein